VFKLEFKEKIKLFRTLHDQNNPLMLPNAWDASSAKIFERNDFQAIGTTSAGIAATLGYPDGEKIPLELMLNSISNISKNTKLPVSADIEGGYAANIFDLRKILNELEKFEVVGINIEDGRGTYLREINEQKVILDFIKAYSPHLFINARIDSFWLDIGDLKDRIKDVIVRAEEYKKSGADCIFIPGVKDIETIKVLRENIELPINLLQSENLNSMQNIKTLKIERVSLGSSAFRNILTNLDKISSTFKQGKLLHSNGNLTYQDLNLLMD